MERGTLLLCGDNLEQVWRQDKQRGRELVAQQPQLESGGLEVDARLTLLADDEGESAGAHEELVASALVGLPFCDKVAEALVEELLVDDNLVGHGGGDERGREEEEVVVVEVEVAGDKGRVTTRPLQSPSRALTVNAFESRLQMGLALRRATGPERVL
jgi:hypothetical protein